MNRLALTGALAALAISAAPRLALASDADVVREYRDRAEIDALMWHYVHALDSLDESAYAANYTPDGSFKAGKSVSEGTEALKKIITDVKKRRTEQEAKGEKPPQLYHVITNEYVEFVDKDHARIHSYWQTLFAPADPKARPQVAAAGRGIDEVVRYKGHWLIKNRDVTPPANEW
jgi:3-phenylpropionate/cinnamic acid dioxygenase small subunit